METPLQLACMSLYLSECNYCKCNLFIYATFS